MNNTLKDKIILVTGGTGYIGSHTVVMLLEAGADVVILDNLCNSKSEVVNRLEKITGRRPIFIAGDIRNRALLRELFSKIKIDAVIHFAGLKAVGESVVEPLNYYDNNVCGSVALFQEMAHANVKTLVFSSSATVYGNPTTLPIREDSPLGAINPYGQSKLVVEMILADLFRSDESWSIACLRYFNPVGAHVSGLIGEDPSGIPNNLMPIVAQVAVGKRKKLAIFGSNYSTKDGTGVRDYIHVDDLAAGHLAALNALQKPTLLTVNLGTGHGHSVLELIKSFEAASGKSVPFEIVDRRAGDIAACYADPTLAKKLLGWVAQLGIERMCNDSWRWQSKNPHGYAAEEPSPLIAGVNHESA